MNIYTVYFTFIYTKQGIHLSMQLSKHFCYTFFFYIRSITALFPKFLKVSIFPLNPDIKNMPNSLQIP